jgi:threonine dehydrogenase-like Zn-dependent dehydrogenase
LRQRHQLLHGRADVLGGQESTRLLPSPITPGHEFVGEVVALGEGAAEEYGLAIGDHAVSEQIVPCWECKHCKMGAYWMCAVHDIYGFRQRTFGAWAEYMLFPAGALNYKVPESVPWHYAGFVEPLACSIHAVERGDIQYQDTVVIAGCGPLGLGMVAAKMRGPARIIALDLSDERLEVAQRTGADLGINPKKEDAVATLIFSGKILSVAPTIRFDCERWASFSILSSRRSSGSASWARSFSAQRERPTTLEDGFIWAR